MGGYLHLYYQDYVQSKSPHEILNKGKTLIKQKAETKLSSGIQGSSKVKKDFEQLYKLEGKNLVNSEIGQKLSSHEPNFQSFERAISKLAKLVKDSKKVGMAIWKANQVIRIIDRELIKGASTNGLADSAIYEVEQSKKQLQEIVQDLEYVRAGILDFNNVAQAIQDAITGIQSNAAGYLLELAWVEAFIEANEEALGYMISIGGKETNTTNLKIKWDERMKRDYEELKNALTANGDIQSGTDALFNLHKGGVSGTTTWVGFQIKNFNNIKAIEIGNYRVGDYLTEGIYPDDFVVNIAGGLTSLYSEYGPFGPSWKHLTETQQNAAKMYSEMINSTKLLAITDIILGKLREVNMIHERHYWVIRSKTAKEVRVISSSEILNKIKKTYIEQGKTQGVGFSTGATSQIGAFYNRQEFEQINASNFDDDSERGYWNRSIKSFSPIYQKVLDTKININLNFSSFFN